MQGVRREDEGDIPPEIIDWDVNEILDPALPPRRPSSVINLLILSIFLPFEVVQIVEETVHWPELFFGNREAGQVLHIDRVDLSLRDQLARLGRALRHIGGMNWTSDCQYVMQNLQEYKTLLGRLLDELKHCREVGLRSPRPSNLRRRIPEPDQNDLIRHAKALEVLVEELDRIVSSSGTQSLILLEQFDEHIISVHQLIEFLD